MMNIYGDLEPADYESGILDNAINLISNNNHSYASTRSQREFFSVFH